MLHDLQKELYAEDKREPAGPEKELRCINAKNKVVLIKMNVCKQTTGLEKLEKLNNWPKRITPDMDVEEREKIMAYNKKYRY